MYSKVCLIGLDCVPPELVFDLWRSELPNLGRLMDAGVHGPLESTIPPITVPAWMCMMTGRDPGALGIYGFRNRRDRGYENLGFASSLMVREETVWDVLARHGKRSILLGIPLTYPPKPVSGLLISDFMAPDTSSEYTYPPELKDEIQREVGDYVLDVRDFRTMEKDRLLEQIYAMTEQRFKLARHLATTHPWDLFAMVDMGPDRLHHGFWRYFDREHILHEPGSPLEHAIHDYYVWLDAQVGLFLHDLPDDTLVMVVSDHGAKRMDGAICFNEWLIQEGYLTLKPEHVPKIVKTHPPLLDDVSNTPVKLTPDMVDWTRTVAWADGGYYGRLFLNVRGREPQGIVNEQQADALLQEIAAKLESLGDEHGNPIDTKVYRPAEVYSACRGIPPDLIVYFGDLHWRSAGTVGHGTIWIHENDTGPDDANHAQFGIAIIAGIQAFRRSGVQAGQSKTMSIYDIAPSILTALGVEAPQGMGRASVLPAHSDSAYSADEEAEIARRLEELGYL